MFNIFQTRYSTGAFGMYFLFVTKEKYNLGLHVINYKCHTTSLRDKDHTIPHFIYWKLRDVGVNISFLVRIANMIRFP